MDDLVDRLKAAWAMLNDDGDEYGLCDTLSEAAAALEAAREDAERYRWLRTKLMAANFHPEDPNGLDLGEGVALIFLLPSDSHVTPDLDWTIDQARAKENGND